MSITRLTGGLSPADGADPRTFPQIWNVTASEIESLQSGLGVTQSQVTSIGGSVTVTAGIVDGHGTAIATLESNVSSLGSAVDVIEAWDLDDLNDVEITSPGDSQVLAYSTAVSGWVNVTFAAGGVPSGMITSFAMDTAPTGWLKANGANVSRSTYSALFDAIGTTFGVGDGSTTFGLPDMRGEFLRGWDDGRAVDTDRVFGSAQGHQLESHSHTYTRYNTKGTRGSGTTPNWWNNDATIQTGTSGSTGTFGAETRPRNVALLFCIKF
jgi:microcystin-dependent protein